MSSILKLIMSEYERKREGIHDIARHGAYRRVCFPYSLSMMKMNTKHARKLISQVICCFLPVKKWRKATRNLLLGKEKEATATTVLPVAINPFDGLVYAPLYNLHSPIQPSDPEVYNQEGEKLIPIFLRDVHTAHQPYIPSKYCLFDRYNYGIKTHFYTHQAMLEQMGKPDKKYGLLLETPTIVPEDYEIFKRNPGLEKDYDLIFTYDEAILDAIPNARFVPFFATPWCTVEKNKLQEKHHSISLICSDKTVCDLHVKRLQLARQFKRSNLVDTFGTFDGGAYTYIADTLIHYRFSIAIENNISAYCFAERLTSCFATMTIPIYLGATKISEFFNPDGIIIISEDDLSNLEPILRQCTREAYEERLPAVIDNYQRVQKYTNIWDNLYTDYIK